VLLLLDEPWLGCVLTPLAPLELVELAPLLELPDVLEPDDELDELDELAPLVELLFVAVVDEALAILWSVRFQTRPKSAMEATARLQRALRRATARPATRATRGAPRLAPAPLPLTAGTACVARRATGCGAATPSSAMLTSPSGCATQLST
jgi:hypothetical protein